MTCKHLCATLALTLLPVCALQVQSKRLGNRILDWRGI